MKRPPTCSNYTKGGGPECAREHPGYIHASVGQAGVDEFHEADEAERTVYDCDGDIVLGVTRFSDGEWKIRYKVIGEKASENFWYNVVEHEVPRLLIPEEPPSDEEIEAAIASIIGIS